VDWHMCVLADDWFCPVCVKEGRKNVPAPKQEGGKAKKANGGTGVGDSEESDDESDDEEEDSEEDEEDEESESDESEEEEDDRVVDKIVYIRRKKKKDELTNGTKEKEKGKEKEEEEGEKGTNKDKKTKEDQKKKTNNNGFGDDIEILVKWKDRAYLHCEWIDERTILRLARIKYSNYLRSLVLAQSFSRIPVHSPLLIKTLLL
jgi:hypothetical protein